MAWQRIKAIKEQLGQIATEMRTILTTAESDNARDLNAEERAKFDEHSTRAESLKSELARLESAKGLADFVESRSAHPGRGAVLAEVPEPDARRYSLTRAIGQLMRGHALDGIEKELSDEIATRAGKSPQGFYFPVDVALGGVERRALDLTAGSGAKATITDAANFIDLLRAKAIISQMGARMLTGLTGDLSIPKQTAGGTAYWVTEGNSPTASNQTIGQLALAPKTVGAYTDISRKFILQSSISAEQFVRDDLANVLALELSRAALNGSGTGAEPQGILQNGSVTTVAGGTNGLALNWANVVAMETAVAVLNADAGNLQYVTNPKVRGALKTTEKAGSTAQFIWSESNTVNGYSAKVTTQMPSNLTKGTGTNLSSAIFGNWSDLILGMWGGLDILVDPYTGGTAGTVRVIMLQDVDIKLRRTESFAKMVDIIA